jgi:squalene-hopene/tetraprenyl-beta-curcumene cyclase
VSAEDEAIVAGLNWLAVHQQPGGGCCEAPSGTERKIANHDFRSASASASQTAWALLAFAAAGQADRPAALRAVNFLIETQQEDGTWNEPHFVLHDPATNRWLRNDLHAVAWPLLALSRWAWAAGSAQPADSREMSYRLVGAAADN